MDRITPLQAIKNYCKGCCCGSAQEVRLCPTTACPLYPFRSGHNPWRKVELTEEQRAAAGERMRKARNNEKNLAEVKDFLGADTGKESGGETIEGAEIRAWRREK